MKAIAIIGALVLSFSTIGQAQSLCDAEAMFEGIQCQQRNGGEKCVSITVVGDLNGLPFEYEWELGDGSYKIGKEIDHCYADYDVYKVKLHLIDPTSGFRFDNELIETINIEDAGAPQIITDKQVTIKTDIKFDYKLASEEFVVSEAYWSFGGKTFSCDIKPVQSFDKMGEIEVKLLLVGFKKGVPIQVCASKIIDVREFVIDGKHLNDVFTQKEKTLKDRGRFLNDEVHYILYEKDDHTKYQLLDIKHSKYNVTLEVDKEYEMYAWKGNLFTPIQRVSTNGLSKVQAEESLKEAVQILFSKPPVHIEGFRFEMDQSEPPSKAILQVSEIMSQYTHVNIGIGVYTHTGGRINKNLELSRQRGEKIRKALELQGIDTDRLVVLTAREEHDLLNTCYGVVDCDLEDESLNRKAEFKVERLVGGGVL